MATSDEITLSGTQVHYNFKIRIREGNVDIKQAQLQLGYFLQILWLSLTLTWEVFYWRKAG